MKRRQIMTSSAAKESACHGGEAKGYFAGSDTLARVRPIWQKFRPTPLRGPQRAKTIMKT
jgi:hypothetical protein